MIGGADQTPKPVLARRQHDLPASTRRNIVICKRYGKPPLARDFLDRVPVLQSRARKADLDHPADGFHRQVRMRFSIAVTTRRNIAPRN
jgi:hypothetical protein